LIISAYATDIVENNLHFYVASILKRTARMSHGAIRKISFQRKKERERERERENLMKENLIELFESSKSSLFDIKHNNRIV